MNIGEYKQELTSEMMELLLTADPNEAEVISYLPKSKVIVCRNKGKCIGIAALVISGDSFELKNIAISVNHQGQGIAKLIIAQVKDLAKELGAITLEVGTGNSSFSQLALYQKCGFRIFHVEQDFFRFYPQPIYENGILCIDMVRLRVKL